MNFKIQQTYPSPVIGVTNYSTLTYAKHINSIILYGQQKLQSQNQAQQPKKKIAFKVDKSSAPPSTDKISIFSLTQRKWIVKQATGKIPNSRTDFKTVYMHPCVILYGGKTNGKLVNEVFALNCENWVWKKLFSLDGPPTSDESQFFKITEHTAGLIVANSLWLLQLVDVKWQLSANQLPGSVWQKVNVPLPQNVKFCWPLNQDILLVIGEKSTYQISLQKKQKVAELNFNFSKFVSSNEKQTKTISCFVDPKAGLQLLQPPLDYSFIVTEYWINLLKFNERSTTKITGQDKKQNNYHIPLQRSLKCCAYVPVEEGENPNSSYIFYLDSKAQLISVQMNLVNEQPPSTVRKITSDNQLIESNSCIEEQQNQDSSVVIPHSNSRVNIGQESQTRSEVYFNDDNFDNGDYLVDSRLIQNERKEVVVQRNKLAHQKMVSREEPISKAKFERLQQDLSQQQIETVKQQKKNQQQTSRKNIYNMSVSHSNPVQLQKNKQKSIMNQKIKHKTQEYLEQKRQYSVRQNELHQENPSDSIQLKHKLQNIMCNQIIKRKLLESKVQALESIIKKSEKFVLMLCRYGNQSDKQKHIDKVKELRQQLQWNWTKEIYYRKEMQMNKMPSVVSQQIQQTMQHIQY